MNILCLSFYNLDYGIGASASSLDELNSLPHGIRAFIIEPNRVDLPRVKVVLSDAIQRYTIPLPLTRYLSFLHPFLSFFYGLKTASNVKMGVVFSMHHPFHSLSFTGHVISRILHVPHVVQLQDVLRPMGVKLTIFDHLSDILERIVAKLIKDDLMVFVCSENRQILESRTKTKFHNVLILPNCVSQHLVQSVQLRKTVREKTIHFIFVGRIGPEYGLSKIQRLLSVLPSFGYEPRLLVVGHNQVGMPDSATYIGSLPRKETMQLIAESDVGIGPMYPTIAVPRKVVEYLALGKVVIIGKNAVSRDIIKEFGESILEVSENDDVNQVANKLLTMLKNANFSSKKMDALYCESKMQIILDKALSRKKTNEEA